MDYNLLKNNINYIIDISFKINYLDEFDPPSFLNNNS